MMTKFITVNVTAGRKQQQFKTLMTSASFIGAASLGSRRKSYSVSEEEYIEKKTQLKALGVTKAKNQ